MESWKLSSLLIQQCKVKWREEAKAQRYGNAYYVWVGMSRLFEIDLMEKAIKWHVDNENKVRDETLFRVKNWVKKIFSE